MHKVRIIFGLFFLILSGCSPTATTPANIVETNTPITSINTETLFTPTTTPVPSLFELYLANPVLAQSSKPAWDSFYLDPGAVIYYNGEFHMFYNGISKFPATVGIGYATSPDGYQWTRQTSGPVLSAEKIKGTDLIGSNFFVTSGIVEDDGTWVLYFYTLRGNAFQGVGDIGRATASSPYGPWEVDSNPMLSPGTEGSWDEVQVVAPNVIKTDSGYRMYYDGLGQENNSMIGLATSEDGINWIKYNDPNTNETLFTESDPVLSMNEGSWDSVRVIDPNVSQTSNGWVMVYLSTSANKKFGLGDYAFGAAKSSDGIHWKKITQNPILTKNSDPEWNRAYLASLVYANNMFFLFFDFESVHGTGTNVYLATFEGLIK